VAGASETAAARAKARSPGASLKALLESERFIDVTSWM
jgi:hypothetical protein